MLSRGLQSVYGRPKTKSGKGPTYKEHEGGRKEYERGGDPLEIPSTNVRRFA